MVVVPSMWLHTSAMAFRACFSVSNSDLFAVNTVEVSLEGFCTFSLALAEGNFEISVYFCA